MQSRIISLGESVVDILPAAGGLWRPVPGGSSYNFALALGRLGAPCAFAGRLSSDEQGERMAAILLAAGVDLDLCERDERPSPLALVKTGAEGPAFEIYLDGTAHAPPALEPGWLDDAAHLHVSSFSAVSGAWGEAVLAALLSARGRVSASLDVNIRPRLVPPRETTLAEIEMRIALVDVIKASDADLAWLRPDQAPLTTAREWARRFDCPVLLTLGAAGAVACLPDAQIEAPGISVEVVDTVGAGDCFVAAFLAKAVEAGDLAAKLRDKRLVGGWLSFANAAAALCCARAGADPADRSEIEAFRRSF
ncbi:MAG: carbohydrate kinase [Beijerinckiaceae bacterium]